MTRQDELFLLDRKLSERFRPTGRFETIDQAVLDTERLVQALGGSTVVGTNAYTS